MRLFYRMIFFTEWIFFKRIKFFERGYKHLFQINNVISKKKKKRFCKNHKYFFVKNDCFSNSFATFEQPW